MRIFGIDPGSERTGYGCVETDGFRHRLVQCGAITSPALTPFADKTAAAKAGFDTSKPYAFQPFTPQLPEPLGEFHSFVG